MNRLNSQFGRNDQLFNMTDVGLSISCYFSSLGGYGVGEVGQAGQKCKTFCFTYYNKLLS